MQMEIVELGPDAQRIILQGRLDAAGTGAIELRLTATVAPVDRHALLDLNEVPFVSSLGIRMILTVARTLQRRGRRLVLIGAQPAVMEVFETVALGTLVPIAVDVTGALELARG